MREALACDLRAALQAADFTHDRVAAALGPTAQAALARNETTPGLRAAFGDSSLEVLIRLWLLQVPVSREDAERALPDLVDRLVNAGFLLQSIGEVAARIDIRPYAADDQDLWVASDLTPGLDGSPNRVGPDFVLGVSSASVSLAQMTIRDQVGSALDLGTGCGVQSLHLTQHADLVVATDVNERALRLARFNADLNEVDIDVRSGSYFEPVVSEAFDLIVTNPPFVISPATHERLVYRDSGLPGDRVVEHIVTNSVRHLNPGGVAQVLANWMIFRDRPWEERIGEWINDADAFVVQREVVDLPTYVELWLKDAGLHGAPEYRERYETWLSWFAEQGAEAVGFGWINLRRTDQAPRLRMEDWPYEVEQPIGPELAAQLDRLTVTDPYQGKWYTRSDVVQETLGPVGVEDPSQIIIRQQRGLRRARQVSTAEAALVGACDGDLTLGQIQAALEQLGVGQVSS
ncbi:MAG TPA: methyltransferase, partial [Marmoricola sp.]|nr:methyltransferase [Marmoricola sp.]